jgi:leader peptidase (prepilin peptidase)/N-methyltransferase
MVIELLLDCAFLIVIAVCAVTDWKSRRIPNMAILALIGLAAVKFICYLSDGRTEIWYSFLILIPVATLMSGWNRGNVGAGDIKLMAAAGIYLGIVSAIAALLTSLVIVKIKFAKDKSAVPFAVYFAPCVCAVVIAGWIIKLLN